MTREGTLSVLFSSAEQATLMYATPEQFEDWPGHQPGPVDEFLPRPAAAVDLATMQEAVHFSLERFSVEATAPRMCWPGRGKVKN
jgi:methylmalonyl-CoA mutase